MSTIGRVAVEEGTGVANLDRVRKIRERMLSRTKNADTRGLKPHVLMKLGADNDGDETIEVVVTEVPMSAQGMDVPFGEDQRSRWHTEGGACSRGGNHKRRIN